LSELDVDKPVAKPLETTEYFVTATLENGCAQTVPVTVVVVPPPCDVPFVFFPTGFSPNNDGENDQLKMESNIVDSVYWAIFNRWGERIFEAFSIDDAWDGTFRGQPQPMETYGFYYKIRCVDGQEAVRKGNVTLLR
jgi:gliding motility-associated-like protein